MPSSEVTQNQANNYAFLTENALKIRLETKELLRDLRLFLEGKQLVVKEDANTNKRWVEEIELSDPLVNERGLQALMAKATLLLNPSTVQGNYTPDMYHNHISMMRKQLAYDIAVNNKNWGIAEENMHYIANTFMDTVKCYLSRLIDNWERRTLMPLSGGTQKAVTDDPNSSEQGLRR